MSYSEQANHKLFSRSCWFDMTAKFQLFFANDVYRFEMSSDKNREKFWMFHDFSLHLVKENSWKLGNAAPTEEFREKKIFPFATHQMKATAKVHKVHKINYDV